MSYLMQKGKIGSCTIKNRVVMPPMTTGLAGADGTPGDMLLRFYEERAKGGVGLIITEIFQMNTETGKLFKRQMNALDPANNVGLAQLTATVHKYGTKIFAQLHHGGSANDPTINDGKLYSASDVPNLSGIIPTPLTKEQIHELTENFVKSAITCKAVGFDGVEIHCAHGYLLLQFLSGGTNHREDEYGGSLENRCRFPVEIIQKIKQACGKDFPVSVRLSVDEYDPYHENSIKLEEGIEIAKRLEAAGADVIDVSCCNYFSVGTAIEPYSMPQGWRKDNSKAVRDAVNIPVISTNNIKLPSVAEELLEGEYCDFVAIGRGNLVDPEWTRKACAGAEDSLRSCIGCLYCFESLMSTGYVRCSLNPRLGQETLFPTEVRQNGKGVKVAVVGAGPAGLEAAIILGQRGFDVTVYEKNQEPGGAVRLAGMTAPYKKKVMRQIEVMVGEAERAGVKFVYGKEITPEELAKESPAAVFLAGGGKAVVPPVDGVSNSNVVFPEEVLTGKVKPSGKVAVIGAGLTGLETAEYICHNCENVEVSIIDMLPEIGSSIYPVVFLDVMGQLAPYSPKQYPAHMLTAIKENAVQLKKLEDGTEVTLEADYVVLALGVKPDHSITKTFEEVFDRVMVLGENKVAPGRIGTSIRDGYIAAYGYDPEV